MTESRTAPALSAGQRAPERAPSDVVALEPGVQVLVRIPGADLLLPSAIDSIDNGQLLVGVPFMQTRPVRGEILTVEWGGQRGWYSVQTAFEGVSRPERRHWILRPIGAAHLMQRRNYARAQIGLPVVLVHTTVNGPRTLDGTLLDVSEGGARAVVPAPGHINIGDRVVTMLSSERLRLVAAGAVVRAAGRESAGSAEKSLDEISIAFTQPVTNATELRREVLRWQQRERLVRNG
jgi:hypothetical protein